MHSVYEPHHVCNTHHGYSSYLARRKPGAFLIKPDWVIALIPKDRKQRRQTKLLAALAYRARLTGPEITTDYETLAIDTQGELAERTIRRGLADLETNGCLAYRSNGRGVIITLAECVTKHIRPRAKMADENGHEDRSTYKEERSKEVCKKIAVAFKATSSVEPSENAAAATALSEQAPEIEHALVTRAVCAPVAKQLARMYVYTVALAIILAVDAIARRKTITPGMYVAAFRSPDVYVPPTPPPAPPRPPTAQDIAAMQYHECYEAWCTDNSFDPSDNTRFLQYLEENPPKEHTP